MPASEKRLTPGRSGKALILDFPVNTDDNSTVFIITIIIILYNKESKAAIGAT